METTTQKILNNLREQPGPVGQFRLYDRYGNFIRDWIPEEEDTFDRRAEHAGDAIDALRYAINEHLKKTKPHFNFARGGWTHRDTVFDTHESPEDKAKAEEIIDRHRSAAHLFEKMAAKIKDE